MTDAYRCPACGSSSPVAGIGAPRCPICQIALAEFEVTCLGCKQVSKGPEISSPGYCPQCGDRYPFAISPPSPNSSTAADTASPARDASAANSPQPTQTAPITPPIAEPAAKAAVAAEPPPANLLARLKQQAAEKLVSEARQTGLQEQQKRAISSALSNTYSYLRDFTSQVNVLKPDYPAIYFLSEQVKFDGLTWQEGFPDYRMVAGATDNRLFDRVTLSYVLKGKNPIIVEREPPGIELFARTLNDHGLLAETQDFKNDRARTVRTSFTIKREIRATLLFVGDYVAGDIRLSIRNVQRLGSEEYRIPSDVLTHTTLEEIALLVLGESRQFVQRFKRVA